MALKAIGPSFFSELQAAGLAGLPFNWSADGTLVFAAAITPAQIAAVQAVYAAHDPAKPAPTPPASPLHTALATAITNPALTASPLLPVLQAMLAAFP